MREKRDEREEASAEFWVLSAELKTGEKSARVRISENSEPRTQNFKSRQSRA